MEVGFLRAYTAVVLDFKLHNGAQISPKCPNTNRTDADKKIYTKPVRNCNFPKFHYIKYTQLYTLHKRRLGF